MPTPNEGGSHFDSHLLNTDEFGWLKAFFILQTKRDGLPDPDVQFVERTCLSVTSMQGGHTGDEPAFRVTLDHTEFRGKIGFPVFRRAVELLLGRIGERLRLKMDIPVYASEQTGQILFSIPALFEDGGQVNVMMLGVDAPQAGITTLKLQFLDPEQFRQKPPEAGAA